MEQLRKLAADQSLLARIYRDETSKHAAVARALEAAHLSSGYDRDLERLHREDAAKYDARARAAAKMLAVVPRCRP
jgi:spore germination protein YaaH